MSIRDFFLKKNKKKKTSLLLAQLGLLSNICKQIKNLGVIFDSSLSFDKQIIRAFSI